MLCSVFAVTACSGPTQMELDRQSNICERVHLVIYDFENLKTEKRITEMEGLCSLPLDKATKKLIAREDLHQLMRILRVEDNDVVKYYTILFIGNLGKEAKKAVPLLKMMRRTLPGSPAANKPYKQAIRIALEKIEGKKKKSKSKRRAR